MKSDNIYLIGPMGAGKTTIGKLLAQELQLPFYDSDKVIEEQTGVDIATIFAYEGEDGFRKREVKTLQELTKLCGIVLATGGGGVLDAQNRRVLQENGVVVYISCSADKLLQRTSHDKKRPLLQDKNPAETIATMLKQRQKLYETCADFVVETGDDSSFVVAKDILHRYQCHKNQL